MSDGAATVNIRECGAVEGEDVTGALSDAVDEAAPAGGVVAVPAGTWVLSDKQAVPEGVVLRGAGYGSRLKLADSDASTGFMLYMKGPHAGVERLRLDANVENRTDVGNTGAVDFYRSQNCWMDTCWVEGFGGTGSKPGGSGVVLQAPESDSDSAESTTENVLRSVEFDDREGRSEFGCRLVSDWTLQKASDEFDALVADNQLLDCRFHGCAKSAVEIAGPAARRNALRNCHAVESDCFTAVFEVDFGGSSNLMTGCSVVDAVTGDSSIYGFGVRGGVGDGYPDRPATGNRIVDCTVQNLGSRAPDAYAGAVEVYAADGTVVRGLTVDGVSVNPATDPHRCRGVKVDQSVDTVVADCHFRDLGDPLVDLDQTDTRIRDCTYRNVGFEPAVELGDNGTRVTVEGVGVNDGDPNCEGQWCGHGREGVRVRDPNSGVVFLYQAGRFHAV